MLISRIYQDIKNDSARGFQFFSVCRQGVTLVIGIILAKSTLNISEIGVYEIWMFLGLVISFAGMSGLLQSFLVQYPGVSESKKGEYILTCFIILWLCTGFIAGLIYLFKKSIFLNLLGTDAISHLPLVLGFLLLHLNSILTPYIFLVKGKAGLFIPYSIFYITGHLLAILVPLLIKGDLWLILQILIIWASLEQIILLMVLRKTGRLKILFERIKPLVSVAVPLTFYSGSGMLAQIFDAWLVNHTFEDLGVFAIFKYGARELPGAQALAAAFSASMMFMIGGYREAGLSRIKAGTIRFMHFFFPISIFLMLWSGTIFEWIYNDHFAESVHIFNTYLLLMISRWVFPQTILMALGKNSDLLYISLSELLLNIVLSLWLVQYLGLLGIALGTVIAFWLEKLLMIILLNKKYDIHLNEYVPVRHLITYSLLLLISYLWVSLN